MEATKNEGEQSAQLTLWLAFAAVYVFWGSTYLALRFVLESIPPFLMAGFRFLMAGSVMLLLARLTHQQWPNKTEMKNSVLVGFLLLVVGNGGVVWAEQYIDSGLTALIITIEPVWVVLLLWMKSRRHKPSAVVWIGIIIGFIGMFVLVGPAELTKEKSIHTGALIALFVSSISWALGSIFVLRANLPSSASMSTGVQMLSAGIIFLLISTVRTEWADVHLEAITTKSWLGFGYLVVFGSLLGYTAYGYIVRKASPTSVSTYAYINPVIAVFLGWWLGNERVGVHTIVAACLMVSAVALIIMKPSLKFNLKTLFPKMVGQVKSSKE